MKIGFLYSIIRMEEKMLLDEASKKNCTIERISDDLTLDFDKNTLGYGIDVLLDRCISHLRALYILKIVESYGIKCVNSQSVVNTCGDKALTSLELIKKGVPSPKTVMAFTPDSALNAIEKMGYPVVIKPPTGSWARLLAKINDREAAEAVIEHKSTLGSYHHSVFYLQEYISKPQRDIRAFVVGDETIAAIYRTSPHWITNTARGGKASKCEITDELNNLCLKAAEAVGGGVLAIDIMETNNGFVVHEVNHTTEFRNSVAPTGVNIPGRILDYVIQEAKR